ncbi:hypothetical protein A3A21_02210 [Candidatus Jorgensenbacteria bacterium RIFCSPLOWO2_01_FULL_45_25b]|uniref:UPF0235 protein A3A21_02210 n=1 Tax=Candidatus Jorgensenbacteria bacterium RIFCSPLOWO2_01_FULL_45_25b TaxID=1798471 RepID=A0A1F6BXM0_9BACT|nr:MAG: hypothetical protein A3A21_02210 [Candidatus Jorgensenbacteria bacterium RIFCSPLOWO2_01_FULL_45_25b]
MKIYVRAKPKSKKEYVKKLDEIHFEVAVREPPEDGKANQAVIKKLKEYFNLTFADISLVSGNTSKEKVFEINKDV